MPEERRVVTVLFADVAGSTALGETNDPEDVRAVLRRYYDIAREVVAEHGGTLEKFIGDAVMAIFGLPQAHGDDAERGLAAALALREAVARDPHTAALQLRIGVNTGEVVATRDTANSDFLVTGDVVNVAARLQQSAEPGVILAGERTRRAVAGAFRFADERHIEVKGKREALSAAVLEEKLSGRRPALTPFVGREGDLAQLALVAARAFGEKRPQLVTVTAPAGTGKSRLVDEFVTRLAANEGLTVATAQCLPYGAAVTYLPLRGLARGLLGLEREAEIMPAIRQAFLRAGNAPADAERLTSFVGATLGGSNEPEERDREQLFAAWRLLIEALAARGPLVVVFEDLHWASDSLIDLVEHVTLPRTQARLVMIALARPELIDRRPQWGGGRRNFTAIGLEPLSDDETRRLVELLTEIVPGAMATKIAERSGGNPFFAGELVRAYEDRKRAGAEDAEIVLPDTVHATVLARIDGLPEDERAILEYAAVAGRTARVEMLRALLSDRSAETISAALEALAERDLLVGSGADAYTFRHIVIREVAYATLPRAERVKAHLRLADWLEARGEEVAELVAYHYRQAIALSPAGRVPDGLPVAKVVAALERAARVAWNGGGYNEAIASLDEAIRLSPPSEHLRLMELKGDVLRVSDGAVAGYAGAYARWRATGDPDPAIGARLLVKRLGVVGRWSGSLTTPPSREEFVAEVAEARALLERAPHPYLEAQLTCARVFAVMRWEPAPKDVLERWVDDVERAARFFAARGDVQAESMAFDALGAIYRSGLGDWEAAIACADRRLVNADRLDLLERIDAWSVKAWDNVYLGRYAAAARAYDEARLQLRPGEAVTYVTHVAAWSAYAAFLSGAWDQVIRLADALVAVRDETTSLTGRFTTPGWIAAIRVASARLDTTRLARYRAAFVSVADLGALRPDHPFRGFVTAFLDGGTEGMPAVKSSPSPPERQAEAISALLFEHDKRIEEDMLGAMEDVQVKLPSLLTTRVQLARALNAGTHDALAGAVAALDTAGIVADAARAAALLAITTGDRSDRADAERRLGALGDRAFLARLREG